MREISSIRVVVSEHPGAVAAAPANDCFRSTMPRALGAATVRLPLAHVGKPVGRAMIEHMTTGKANGR